MLTGYAKNFIQCQCNVAGSTVKMHSRGEFNLNSMPSGESDTVTVRLNPTSFYVTQCRNTRKQRRDCHRNHMLKPSSLCIAGQSKTISCTCVQTVLALKSAAIVSLFR